MGVVYRAVDGNLGRDVAIKVLSASFKDNPDSLARFKREAQALASLNHSNIATIYGFEESGDTTAIVMEYVEGDTLADRVARGPMEVQEAIVVFQQIANGLAAAHENAR